MSELLANGVPAILWKGAEHFSSLSHTQAVGFLGDIDLLVPRVSLEETKACLHRMGYRQSFYDKAQGTLVDRDIKEITSIEAVHYELAPFNLMIPIEVDDEEAALALAWDSFPVFANGRQVAVAVSLDVHHQVATDIPSGGFFERAVPSSSGYGSTLSAADHLWITASRYYVEVALHEKRSLRDYLYMALMLRSGSIDWEHVINIAEALDMRPALYYPLLFADAIVGDVIPPDVIRAIDPRLGSRHRDWGWQLSVLFDALDAPPFSGHKQVSEGRTVA
jgi:hypothetical protein